MTDSIGRVSIARLARVSGSRWLVLGAVLMLFANGNWTVPILVWLAPVPWLVYLERSRDWLRLPALLAVAVLVNFVIWRGIIPAPGMLYYLVAAIYAFVYFLPFVAHRALAGGAHGFLTTLVFPTSWVAIEFVFQRWVTPYGSWASLAYTQDSLALLQLASVGGAAGISFLITWLAAVLAWLMRPEPDPRRRRHGALACASVMFAVFALGQVRLAWPPDMAPAMRVAGIAPDIELRQELDLAVAALRRDGEFSEELMRRLQTAAGRSNGYLLERTRAEARAGATLIAWSETAAGVLATDEAAFVDEAAALARTEGIHLLLALGALDPIRTPPYANKVVMIEPSGRVAWEYHKAHPIVGAESPFIDAGDGIVPILDMGAVRVGAAICHDLDFPALLHQASARELGLIVAPANDWPLIARLHADMAALRAIENGIALLRPTSGGRSVAIDALGRRVAVVDEPDNTMVAYLPVRRINTLYELAGYLFPWLCVIGLLIGGLLQVANPRAVSKARTP